MTSACAAPCKVALCLRHSSRKDQQILTFSRKNMNGSCAGWWSSTIQPRKGAHAKPACSAASDQTQSQAPSTNINGEPLPEKQTLHGVTCKGLKPLSTPFLPQRKAAGKQHARPCISTQDYTSRKRISRPLLPPPCDLPPPPCSLPSSSRSRTGSSIVCLALHVYEDPFPTHA